MRNRTPRGTWLGRADLWLCYAKSFAGTHGVEFQVVGEANSLGRTVGKS